MAQVIEPSSGEPKQQDTTYLIIVGALMLLIIATLAVLWITERRGRQRAEADLASAKRISEALQNAIANFNLEGMAASTRPAAAPISRADTFSRAASLDGRQRTVYMISADAGRRIGFLPGDIIEVGQPASAPAAGMPGL